MSTVVVEKWESRSASEGESPTTDLVYVVMGTDNDLTAKTAIEAELPATYDGLVYQDYTIERVGDEAWLVEARYGLQSPKDTGDSTYQFETGGGSQRISAATKLVVVYSSNHQAPASAPHVRHRRFTDWTERLADWRLLRHVPQPYPGWSFSDFWIFAPQRLRP
jgi:hypothetical protein